MVLVWPTLCWKLIICPEKICPPSPPQNHIIVPLVENGFINLIMRDIINMLNCCDLISPFVWLLGKLRRAETIHHKYCPFYIQKFRKKTSKASKVPIFPKIFRSLGSWQFNFSASLQSFALNYNIFPRNSSISIFSGSLRSHLIITRIFLYIYTHDFVYYTSLFIITTFQNTLLLFHNTGVLARVTIIIA